MDPAILNYLQSQQQPNQMSNMGQAPQQQTPYNPFDTGIRAAINSARESLGMTQKQQDKALRSSMLSFANNIGQQPRERGFWNNVGQVGRALEPAINTYDQEENTALNENNALGNQILKYKGAEQDRQAKAEEQAFWRSHAQEQLGETRRNNNLLDNFRRNKSTSGEHGGEEEDLGKVLNQAETFLNTTDENTHRGYGNRFFNKFIPGGIQLTKDQAAINTLGDVLRGKLFNAWGYRNQAEFEHVPSISADNSKEVNLENLRILKSLLLHPNVKENNPVPQNPTMGAASQEPVIMKDPETGEEGPIPIERMQEALDDGLILVNE